MKLVTSPKVIIQLMGVAPNGRPPPVPTFVKDCDFDAAGGFGVIVMTQNRDEAKKFDTALLALEFYRTQSKKLPLWSDGKPNRPLTAYHVQIMNDDLDPL